MKLIKIAVLWFLVCLSSCSINAQSEIQSYSFKKGEVLDILMLTTKPEGEALFERYKKTAFPVALKRGYQPMPGFAIKESTQSSFHPENFLFGKWNNLENREKFLTEIETQVPDFHKQRRDIWSIFNITYYEIPNDITFKINKEKYNVVTAYWKKDANTFNTFKKEWIQRSKNKGAKNIIALAKGISPLGYYYNPDYMVITQWENKAAFEAFYKENLKMSHKGVKDVNQFVIN